MSPYDRHYRRERDAIIKTATHCAICGGPLYPGLVFPHPMSTTADHVVELDRGGPHVGNLRAAHLRCNSRRGARYGNRRRNKRPRQDGPRPSRNW